MKGSHGTKPAVGPYRFDDPEMIEAYALATISNLESPWVGDRIAHETMRGILTIAWYALTQLGYYERLDSDSFKREAAPRVRTISRSAPDGG
jgi:hypothetical protein